MPRFSVSVNNSAKYIVPAKNIVGAVKSALPLIEEDEPDEIGDDVEIRVVAVVAKEKVK